MTCYKWRGPLCYTLHNNWYTGVIQQEGWEGKNKYQTDDCYSNEWTIFRAAGVIPLIAVISTVSITTLAFLSRLENSEWLLNDKAVCQYGNAAEPIQHCSLPSTPLPKVTD